jgi:hypothetical protein
MENRKEKRNAAGVAVPVRNPATTTIRDEGELRRRERVCRDRNRNAGREGYPELQKFR